MQQNSNKKISNGVKTKQSGSNGTAFQELKSGILSDLRHDLRNPLTVIKGSVDLIIMSHKKTPLPDDTLALIKSIDEEIKRMTTLLGG